MTAKRRAVWVILGLAAAALVVDPVRIHPKRVRTLQPVAPGQAVFPPGGFVDAGVYPSLNGTPLFDALPTRGSWAGSDGFEGEYRTSWLVPPRRFLLFVAGYPTTSNDRLDVEFLSRDGSIRSEPFSDPDPRETWQPWEVSSPPGTVAVRVHAVDGSSQARGWLAFSAPFQVRPFSPRDLWPLFQLGTTAILAAVVLFGPGLAWLGSRPRTPGSWCLAVLPGPLALAALGGLCWGLGPWVPPSLTARIGVVALLGVLSVSRAARADSNRGLPGQALGLVGICGLVAGFAIAKANVSSGPPGELYFGRISRTLEVGARSDSRIPFHVVQVVANSLAPFSDQAESYFSPWTFATRGPLAGLVAAPIVLATGGKPPQSMPDQEWQPFDPQGFATYRVSLILLASLAGWAVFGLTAELAGTRAGWLAAVTAILSPFYVHELYFTWPKMFAATCVLTSFLLIVRQRYFTAGIGLAIGHLFHPSALLSAPFLALWALACRGTPRERLGRLALFALGPLCLVGPWMLLDFTHKAAGLSQARFFSYFLMADGLPLNWASWFHTRWNNFASTFVPFYLTLAQGSDPAINLMDGHSDAGVHFDFLYWDTFPFALGLPAFLALLPALGSALRRAPAAVWVAFAGPAILLVAYWGADDTGLMRECGHAIFLSFIVLTVWTLYQPGPSWKRRLIALLASPVFLAIRAVDLSWMAFGTSLRRFEVLLDSYYGWNDRLSLAIAAACLAAAVIWMARILHRAVAEQS
jgi:hypothetical protein